MSRPNFEKIRSFELRSFDDSIPSSSQPVAHSPLVLQMVDRFLGQGGVLSKGLREGRWDSLQQAFMREPESLRRFRQVFSESSLLRLYSLESEADGALFANHLMAWVQDHLEDSRPHFALSLYASWAAQPDSELSGLAKSRLELIQGGGGWVATAIDRLHKSWRILGDPVTLAGFALSGGVYSAARAFALPRILAMRTAAPVAGFMATGAATIPEAAAFGAFMNLGQQFFYGQKVDWSWGQFRNLLTAFLTFKATGAMAGSRAPNLGAYAGIVLAHGIHQALGWQERGPGENLLFDSAIFLLELRLGGGLARELAPGVYVLAAAWNRRMQEQVVVQERFGFDFQNSLMAMTEEGYEARIPDRGGSDSFEPTPEGLGEMALRNPGSVKIAKKGAALIVTREAILIAKAAFSLHHPEEAEDIWSDFEDRLTLNEVDILKLFMERSDLKNEKAFVEASGLTDRVVMKCLSSIFKKFQRFVKDPKGFIKLNPPISDPVSSMISKRERILTYRAELRVQYPEEAEQLWSGFEDRLILSEFNIVKALMENPGLKGRADLNKIFSLNKSTINRLIISIFEKLEIFRRDPKAFIKMYLPVNDRMRTISAKQERVLKFKEELSHQYPEEAERLWLDFENRLTLGELNVLKALLENSGIKDKYQLGKASGLSEKTIPKYLESILQQLGRFIRHPILFIQTTPLATDRLKSITAKRERVLQFKASLGPDPSSLESVWDRFLNSLLPKDFEVLSILLNQPELNSYSDLMKATRMGMSNLSGHFTSILTQVEKFIKSKGKTDENARSRSNIVTRIRDMALKSFDDPQRLQRFMTTLHPNQKSILVAVLSLEGYVDLKDFQERYGISPRTIQDYANPLLDQMQSCERQPEEYFLNPQKFTSIRRRQKKGSNLAVYPPKAFKPLKELESKRVLPEVVSRPLTIEEQIRLLSFESVMQFRSRFLAPMEESIFDEILEKDRRFIPMQFAMDHDIEVNQVLEAFRGLQRKVVLWGKTHP